MSDFAFEAFYAESRDPVYRAVVLSTRLPDRAEEAVAEAFARAYARWNAVSGHPNPRAWVVRVALNQFVSGWRIWQRETRDTPDVMAAPDEARSLDPYLLRRLWGLPLRQRQVVALRILLDLDTATTAEVLGIAGGTVGVHLRRGLAGLRTALAGTDYEEASR